VLATPARAGFTLGDALRAMRAEHPLLKSAELAIRAARADQKQARLWTNPMLGASYTKGVRRSSYDDSGYITYGLTQQLELSGAPSARGRVAGLLASAATFDRASLDVSMSLDLESALIDAVAIARKLALYERVLGLLSGAAHIVDQRVAAGAAPRYDATRIGITTAMAQADRESARADYARALAELRASIGPGVARLEGEPSFALDSETPLRPPEQLLELVLARRPDLEAARQRAASASANVSASRRSVWTGVGLDVVGGFGAGPGQQDVGVGLSVPLPAINHGQGLISGAAARAQQAGTLVDAVRITAQLRIDGLHAAVLARRTALADYQRRAVASGDEMLGEAQAGYLAGRFSVLELADAYAAWRDARLRAIELAAATRQAEVDLSREVGTPLREARAQEE
jgi:cobalt-zinc-cadmium efflux system outer membrane protein